MLRFGAIPDNKWRNTKKQNLVRYRIPVPVRHSVLVTFLTLHLKKTTEKKGESNGAKLCLSGPFVFPYVATPTEETSASGCRPRRGEVQVEGEDGDDKPELVPIVVQ